MATEAAAPDTGPLALLLASPMSTAGERACYTDLATETPPDRSLTVLMTGRPETRLRGWREHAGTVPDEPVILTSQRPAEPPSAAEVCHLAAPGDLSALGVRITARIEAWPSTGRSAFCFDSVTALLQFVGVEEAVRFFESLEPRLAAADVVGHLHLNPGAHDDPTVSRFRELADHIITLEGADTEPDS